MVGVRRAGWRRVGTLSHMLAMVDLSNSGIQSHRYHTVFIETGNAHVDCIVLCRTTTVSRADRGIGLVCCLLHHTSRHRGPFTGCTVVHIFVATLGILLNALVHPIPMVSLAAARQMWCAVIANNADAYHRGGSAISCTLSAEAC